MPLFNTRVTECLGIDYPIIAGAMGYVSLSQFVAAVSNAGGLGLLPGATLWTDEELRREIRETRSLTDKPFGVNVGLTARDHEKVNRDINVLIEEEVPVVETAGHTPQPYVDRLKKAGIKVMHKVGTVRHARAAERYGVDLVTIVGFEGEGHTSADEVSTFILIPLAADVLKIPLIAGGGIGDARGFVAARALGAEGVMIGTRFMATHECATHPKLKQLLIQSRETDTVLSQLDVYRTHRVLRTLYVERIVEMERRGASIEDLLPLISGQRFKRAAETGEGLDEALIGAGQVVGLIREVVSVKELIDEIVSGARAIYGRLHPD